MSSDMIIIIGLTLDIIGVGILFFFGPPQPDLSDGTGLGAEDNTPHKDGRTVKEHNQEKTRLRARYKKRSKFALFLIIVGFCFQIFGILC